MSVILDFSARIETQEELAAEFYAELYSQLEAQALEDDNVIAYARRFLSTLGIGDRADCSHQEHG